jgi:hypothetical protein
VAADASEYLRRRFAKVGPALRTDDSLSVELLQRLSQDQEWRTRLVQEVLSA